MQTVQLERPEQLNEVVGQLQRPARALIGWMSLEEAKLSQNGRRMDTIDNLEHTQRAKAAQMAVASRPIGIDQTHLITNTPLELGQYIKELRQNPASAVYFNEGWDVKLVDLSRVCAIQPHVFTDHAEQRVANIDSTDTNEVASVSLPLPTPTNLPAQFDATRQAWVFTSPNPNLRVVGNFSAQVQLGVMGFGFAIAVSPSFLQVAHYRGRYLLRDGYHRAYGFLRRGITIVPAFIRNFTTFEELGLPPGMLPQDAYLGDRPATLMDYLDETVSEDVALPASQKMIVIQGMELSPLG